MAVSRIKVIIGIVALIIGYTLIVISSLLSAYNLGVCIGQYIGGGILIGSTPEYVVYILFFILMSLSVSLASLGIVFLSTARRGNY